MPTLDEVIEKYVRYRDVRLALRHLNREGWSEALRKHKQGGGEHPQEIRSRMVQEWKESEREFFGLMSRLAQQR